MATTEVVLEITARDGSGNVQFVPTFPASCTCGGLSLLAVHICRKSLIRKVPGSLVSAARYATTPEVAIPLSGDGFSRYFIRARTTGTARCPSSGTSAMGMSASTSAFAVAIRPDQFLLL